MIELGVPVLSFAQLSFAQQEEQAGAMDDQEFAIGEQVRVNQVGYLPQAEKVAVVVGNAETFQLRDIRSNDVVLGGNLLGPFEDANSGDTLHYADFSEWQSEGTYVVEVDGGGSSFPFRIGSNVYDYPMLEAARSYTRQRSGTAVHDPITGISFGAGHLQDARARLYFSDEFHDEGDIIDVGGGWYDAGDFGKYLPPSAVTVAQLMLAYELNPERFYRGQLMFPHEIGRVYGDTDMPDLLLEVRFNLAWMEKMQRPDGAVYHKNSGLRWPGFVLPEQDTQTRYVFGLSTFATAQYAGAMAMAARIYEPFDSAFAARALDNARRAQAYLEANPHPYFRRDEGQDSGSGAYSKEADAEERAWAAAELLKTTGEEGFDAYLQEHLRGTLVANPTFVTWYDTSALAQWAYLTSEQADPEVQAHVREVFVAYAGDIVAQIEQDGYRVALTADEYTWASAKNAVAKGSFLILAHELVPDDAYLRGALDQLHYILGRNATGYSYLTGFGTRTPFDIHHRIRAATGTDLPGLLVGGPNRFGGDPLLEAFLQAQNPPPAKAYLDLQGSWATNEYAIDYTAPAFFTLAYFSSVNPRR
jgi:endoglucanase